MTYSKTLTLLATFIIAVFHPLPSIAQSDECPRSGSVWFPSDKYQYRNNRCEGFQDLPLSASTPDDSIQLKAFYVGDLGRYYSGSGVKYPNPLSIKINCLSRGFTLDKFQITTGYKSGRYRLDGKMIIDYFNDYHRKSSFNLDPSLLNKRQVNPDKLRPLATVSKESNLSYCPVVLGEQSNSLKYRFVIKIPYSIGVQNVKKLELKKIETNKKDNAIIAKRLSFSQGDGEIILNWDGNTDDNKRATSGEYQLKLFYQNPQDNRILWKSIDGIHID
jgi:hypothetical protein